MNEKHQTLLQDFEEKQQLLYMDIAKNLLGYLGNPHPSINQLCYLQSLLCQASIPQFLALDPGLTEAEATTLYLSAQGKTIQQIARVCGVCPRQIDRYRAAIFKKLGCKNMSHAVMKGIKLLGIKPPLKLAEQQKQADEE